MQMYILFIFSVSTPLPGGNAAHFTAQNVRCIRSHKTRAIAIFITIPSLLFSEGCPQNLKAGKTVLSVS